MRIGGDLELSCSSSAYTTYLNIIGMVEGVRSPNDAS